MQSPTGISSELESARGGEVDRSLFHPNKYAKVESERRWLLEGSPAALRPDAGFVRVFDLYLAGTRLRLRRIASPAGETLVLKLGQKYRAAGQPAWQTMMTTIYLNEVEYERLAGLAGATLVKRRYPFEYDGRQYSVDIFEGQLRGLILLEIELDVNRGLAKLPKPPVAQREVTDDPFFNGGALARLAPAAFQAWLGAR